MGLFKKNEDKFEYGNFIKDKKYWKHYKKYAFSLCKETPIVIAKLGNDAGIYGAAKMVI